MDSSFCAALDGCGFGCSFGCSFATGCGFGCSLTGLAGLTGSFACSNTGSSGWICTCFTGSFASTCSKRPSSFDSSDSMSRSPSRVFTIISEESSISSSISKSSPGSSSLTASDRSSLKSLKKLISYLHLSVCSQSSTLSAETCWTSDVFSSIGKISASISSSFLIITGSALTVFVLFSASCRRTTDV